jgi:hypothetical protein
VRSWDSRVTVRASAFWTLQQMPVPMELSEGQCIAKFEQVVNGCGEWNRMDYGKVGAYGVASATWG